MPIDSLQNYVLKNNHLPGIPTAQEMQSQQSIGVGQMETTLLQKVEELTLYMIQLQKQNDAMQKEIDELKMGKH